MRPLKWIRFLSRPRLCWIASLVAILSLLASVSRCAYAYTPDSPEVKELLDPAMGYISSVRMSKYNVQGTSEAERLGGRCLLGLAAYKYNKRFGDDPDSLPVLTQSALDAAMAEAAGEGQKDRYGAGLDNYSLGIAIIFLSEVHPQDHLDAIEYYVDQVIERQKPNGGWGYPPHNAGKGDLSQLQYPILGLWAARNAGVEFPDRVMVDAVNYVIRVQDPSGAWGYQGIDPGNYNARVGQAQIRPSLCAAGLGSLFVGSDFMGMSKPGAPRKVSAHNLPPALVPIVERDDPARSRAGDVLKVDRLVQAREDGNKWFQRLSSLRTREYQYYFLYGLERCQSFREKVEGTFEEEPKWYNDGVDLLRDLQQENGSWGKRPDSGEDVVAVDHPIATAFSVLFLLRSTRETIEKVMDRDGLLRGGYGLPTDLTEIRVRGNRIVAPAITGEVEDLITMLEDGDGDNIENMLENPDALSLSGMTGTGREYSARLARILRNGEYKARIVAARTLGRQDSLDNVPILIYALTDPDYRVVKEARDGLRLISRKFDGFGLKDHPTETQVAAAVAQWKQWYKSIRPDAVFIQ